MKHLVWAFIAVLAIAGGTGCHSVQNFLVNGTKGCSECGGQGCQACGKGHHVAHQGHHGQHLQNGDPHYYGQAGGGSCPTCGPGGANAANPGYAGPNGPGTGPGQVSYPYYTTRGPRDFLQDNPRSIGPQ